MDMIGSSLSSSFDQKEAASFKAENSTTRIKKEAESDTPHVLIENSYSLKEESEGVSFRVLEFGESDMEQISEGNSITTSTVPAIPALINGNQTNTAENRLAYIAPKESNDHRNAVVVSGGQFYVISEATTVLATGQRSLVPRSGDIVNTRHTNTREEKRRATHNEVERRRRDKINNWICRLAKILPDCPEMHHKNSQVLSKGGILAKACDTIPELMQQNKQLHERIKDLQRQNGSNDILLQEHEILKNENAALKNENAIMRARLQQHGLLSTSGDLSS